LAAVVLSEAKEGIRSIDLLVARALSNPGYWYTCKVLRGVELFGEPRKSTSMRSAVKDSLLGSRILVPIERLCMRV
jgi:hypothetical protein